MSFAKFDIWNVRQVELQQAHSMPVVSDIHRDTRYYLIVSPTPHMFSGGHVVMCPIKSKAGNAKYSIPVDPNQSNGIGKRSFVYMHQPFSVDQSVLLNNARKSGVLDAHLRQAALNALWAFFI